MVPAVGPADWPAAGALQLLARIGSADAARAVPRGWQWDRISGGLQSGRVADTADAWAGGQGDREPHIADH